MLGENNFSIGLLQKLVFIRTRKRLDRGLVRTHGPGNGVFILRIDICRGIHCPLDISIV